MNNPNRTSAVNATHPFETRVRNSEIRFHMGIFLYFIDLLQGADSVPCLSRRGIMGESLTGAWINT